MKTIHKVSTRLQYHQACLDLAVQILAIAKDDLKYANELREKAKRNFNPFDLTEEQKHSMTVYLKALEDRSKAYSEVAHHEQCISKILITK